MAAAGTGTNEHHVAGFSLHVLSNSRCTRLFFVHYLFIIPLRRHAKLWDDPDELSLLLVSQKALPRMDFKAGVRHSNAGDRTSPGAVASTDQSLLSLTLGSVQREVFSPDPAVRSTAAAEPLMNAMGLPDTSVLDMGVKHAHLQVCHAALPGRDWPSGR